jgi:hypothetical protein
MAYYNPSDRFFILSKESAYGTLINYPTVATQRLYPIVPADGLSMTVDPGQNIIETNIGRGYPYLVNNVGIKQVTGSLSCLVDNGNNTSSGGAVLNAKELIEWGVGSDVAPSALTDLSSYSLLIGAAESMPPNEVYTGLKVASMTLTSGGDQGEQRLTAAYDLVGRQYLFGAECTDNTAITTFPDEADGALSNYPDGNGYYHTEGKLFLSVAGTPGGESEAPGTPAEDFSVSSITMTFTNTLDMGLGTGTTMNWCTLTGRTVAIDMTIRYTEDSWLKAFQGFNAAANDVIGPARVGLIMKWGSTGETPASQLNMNLQTNAIITAFEPINTLNTVSRANISILARLGTSGGDFTKEFEFTQA